LRLAKQAVGVFFSNWLVVPLQFATGVVIVRTLGAEGKGVVVLFTTGIMLLAAIGGFGLPQAAAFLIRREPGQDRRLLCNYLLVVAGFTALVAVGMLWMQDVLWNLFFEGTGAPPVIVQIACATLPLNMITNYTANMALARGQVAAYSRQIVGLSLLSAIGTLVTLMVTRIGLIGAIGSLFTAHLLVALVVLTRELSNAEGGPVRFDAGVFRAMIRYGVQNYLVSLSALVFKRIDNFLIQFFLGTAAVGYYSVARMPYEMLLGIPRAATGLVAGEAAGSSREDAATMVAKASGFVHLLMAGSVVVGAGLAVWLVPLIFGADFAVVIPSLLILLPAALFFGCALILQTYFSGIGQPEINARYTFVAGLLSVLLAVTLIPLMGMNGNALATLLATGFLYGAQAGKFRSLAGIRWLELNREDLAVFLRQSLGRISGRLRRQNGP
jgi:O-antigen/teichoic acid export membrane protein